MPNVGNYFQLHMFYIWGVAIVLLGIVLAYGMMKTGRLSRRERMQLERNALEANAGTIRRKNRTAKTMPAFYARPPQLAAFFGFSCARGEHSCWRIAAVERLAAGQRIVVFSFWKVGLGQRRQQGLPCGLKPDARLVERRSVPPRS